VASAGTQAQAGQTPHTFSQKICRTNGINIAAQGARKFRPEMLEQYDKIYGMSDDVVEEIKKICGEGADCAIVDLFLNELEPGSNNSVPDPLFGPEAWFEVVYGMVDKTCDAIIEKYKQ
jgi:protein-tyrosine phosphatase